MDLNFSNPDTLTQLKDMAVFWLAENGKNLVVALVILAVGGWIGRRLGNLTTRTMAARNVDPLLAGFVGNTVFYAVFIAVAVSAVGQLGVETTSLIAIVGSMGLAIGLAIKDNISNFSSGVMLILFRPFTLGDYVQIAGVAGTVEKITLSTTLLKTPDNQKIIVPNAQIMGTVITNVTGNPTRRIDLTVGIGYGDDMKKAKDVLENVLATQPGLLQEPAWTVAVANLGESSVDLVVRPWVRTEDYWNVRFELTERIKNALDENNISIPFPQRDVHLFNEQAQ
jgi:small conductance mechanosensitive channel